MFAIPIFVFVRESGPIGRVSIADVVGSLAQLKASVAHAREVPGLLRFLVARFFYSDAVNTIIVVMTIVTTRAKGMTDSQALLVLLSLTVVAIIASFGWGWLVDRLGPRRTLMIVLASWAVGLMLGAVSLSVDGAIGMVMFLTAGAILGSGLGGVQVADRVLMVRLSPPERVGEFFGLYGLVGKGSQVIGQLLYGLTLLLFFDALGVGAYQLAVITLLGNDAPRRVAACGRWATMGGRRRGRRPCPARTARADDGAARAAASCNRTLSDRASPEDRCVDAQDHRARVSRPRIGKDMCHATCIWLRLRAFEASRRGQAHGVGATLRRLRRAPRQRQALAEYALIMATVVRARNRWPEGRRRPAIKTHSSNIAFAARERLHASSTAVGPRQHEHPASRPRRPSPRRHRNRRRPPSRRNRPRPTRAENRRGTDLADPGRHRPSEGVGDRQLAIGCGLISGWLPMSSRISSRRRLITADRTRVPSTVRRRRTTRPSSRASASDWTRP